MRALIPLAFVLLAATAHAQSADGRPLQRLELEVGGGWLLGGSAGAADAELLANVRERQPFTLFATEGRFGGSPSLHGRAGMALSRRWAIEGGVVFNRPEIAVSTSADVEGGPSLTITERIDQYFFEGTVVILIDEARLGPRTVPYAAAGGGYLRQLHEGRTVIEHGQVFHAGGGLKHWLMARNAGRVRAAGLRADIRAYFLFSGAALDNRPRPRLAATGGAFFTF